MKIKALTTSAIILSALFSNTLNAQNMPQMPEAAQIITLWEGKIPNSKNINNSKPDEVAPKSFWVTKLDVPSMAYYPATQNDCRTAVIVCPGGGYAGLTYTFEGVMTASWFNSIGISAFVLRYRLPKDENMENRSIGPLQDVQQAIRYVRSHAKEFGINPNHIGVIGFSAGGHLASIASTLYNENVYKSTINASARPDFSILVYPVITMDTTLTHMGSREALIGKDADQQLTNHFSSDKQVTKDTPPAFLVHALDDNLVPYTNSILYTNAMRKNNVQCELHLYAKGDHGLGVKAPTDTQAFWRDACEKWLRMNGWAK